MDQTSCKHCHIFTSFPNLMETTQFNSSNIYIYSGVSSKLTDNAIKKSTVWW